MNPRNFHNAFKAARLKQIRVTSKLILAIERVRSLSLGAFWLTRTALVRRTFEGMLGYRRVYGTLLEAERAAAPYLALTSNPSAYVDLHLELSAAARPSDYPVLFHLNKIVNNRSRTKVFDLGGCAGNLYDSYSAYLDHPERLDWAVNDLPEILAQAQRLRGDRKPSNLRFTDSVEDIADCDVLLVSGALHYFSLPLSEILKQQSARPEHILINRTPLTDGSECATVQDANGFLMPCWLWNRSQLIKGLRAAGYEKLDEWKAPELSLRIPLYGESSIPEYSGLYFRCSEGVEPNGGSITERATLGNQPVAASMDSRELPSAEIV